MGTACDDAERRASAAERALQQLQAENLTLERQVRGLTQTLTAIQDASSAAEPAPSHASVAALIAESEWFDSDWYLSMNPDVAAASLNPALHYVEYGAREGRDPSPRFDTKAYLAAYPHIDASGTNPLADFLRRIAEN